MTKFSDEELNTIRRVLVEHLERWGCHADPAVTSVLSKIAEAQRPIDPGKLPFVLQLGLEQADVALGRWVRGDTLQPFDFAALANNGLICKVGTRRWKLNMKGLDWAEERGLLEGAPRMTVEDDVHFVADDLTGLSAAFGKKD